MVRRVLFYCFHLAVFVPAPLYGLWNSGAFASGFWKAYLAALFAIGLLSYFLGRRRSAGEKAEPARARALGLGLFGALQLNWAMLFVPQTEPVWFWPAAASVLVLLSGVFVGSARPFPNPLVILIGAGVLFGLWSGGEWPAGSPRGGLPVVPGNFFGNGRPLCFWSLAYSPGACTPAELFPGSVLLTFGALFLYQRQYGFEFALALWLAVLCGLFSGWAQALPAFSFSLGVLLFPGRERRTLRGWALYGSVWTATMIFLEFSPHFLSNFYFRDPGDRSSWLFWAAGWCLAESVLVVLRLWKERRDLLV